MHCDRRCQVLRGVNLKFHGTIFFSRESSRGTGPVEYPLYHFDKRLLLRVIHKCSSFSRHTRNVFFPNASVVFRLRKVWYVQVICFTLYFHSVEIVLVEYAVHVNLHSLLYCRLLSVASTVSYTYRARQLYKNISMLFLFPVKDGKLSTGVIAIFNASCYG